MSADLVAALFERLGAVAHVARAKAWYGVQYLSDVRHGMTTRDVHRRGAPLDAERVAHEPTPTFQLSRLLRRLPLRPSDYVFVDLGAGKGAALVIAADRGFDRLVGVDVDQDVLETARANLTALRRRRPDSVHDVAFFAQDAADYDFPRQAAVIYMFNPFGETTMRRVIGNLEQSLTRLPRSLYLVYYNPVHHRVIDDSRLLLPVAVGKRYRVYRSSSSPSAQPGPPKRGGVGRDATDEYA